MRSLRAAGCLSARVGRLLGVSKRAVNLPNRKPGNTRALASLVRFRPEGRTQPVANIQRSIVNFGRAALAGIRRERRFSVDFS